MNIKTPEDVYQFMENIEYGWLDKENNIHLNTMKNFRKDYRTMSIEETIKYKMGVCIEQVYLMHKLLDIIGIKNKMYCTRVYENDDYDNLEEDEHLHCFILYFQNNKVYHMEHPNFEMKGIYEYQNEKDAIDNIVKYYVKLRGGVESPTQEFYDVYPNMSFKEFNNYINHLEKKRKVKK